MDIKRYFEVLELRPDASADQAKQAYKDLVNVWHPDRFPDNPRLRKRSEEKLKDINVAYETIRPFLLSRKTGGPTVARQPEPEKKPQPSTAPGSGVNNNGPEARTGSPVQHREHADRGNGWVQTVFASLYTVFQEVIKSVAAQTDLQNTNPRRQNSGYGNQCGQRGMGKRGRGRGRGRKRK